MKDWRLRRQLSQTAAARAAGVHRQTWRAWESNTWMPEEYNFVGIERALKWQPGSVKAILAGGKPTPDEEAEPILLDDIERQFWAIKKLPPAMRWRHIQDYRAGKEPGSTPGNEGADRRRSGA